METPTLRRSRLEDCAELMPRLRQEDLREIRAAGLTSYGALREGFEGLECYTARDSEGVIAMFGVSPVTPAADVAMVWFLGSRKVDDHKFMYMRYGKKFLRYCLGRYRRIFNYADSRSVKSIRFLELLGFEFDPGRDLVTPEGARFRYFEMEGA